MNNKIYQNKFKAIIFDCDGTLVDSEKLHFFAWKKSIRDWGGDLTEEEYLSYVGKSGETIAKLLANKINCDCSDELFIKKRNYYLTYVQKGLPPIQGTINFVHQLIKEKNKFGIKIALASATVKQEILMNLKNLGLENAFDVVLSGHEDLKDYIDPEGVNKPKPYIYLHAAKLLSVSTSECLVIEDSQTGVMASFAAGCATIAIPNAFSKHHDLSLATLILETLADLSIVDFLEIVNKKSKISKNKE